MRSSARAERSGTSSRRGSLVLRGEGHLGRTDGERVTGLELGALHPLAVHLDSVRRFEVDDPVRRAFLAQLRVPARDVRVLDLDVALARAAEHDAPLVDPAGLAVPREDGDLALDPDGLDVRPKGPSEDPFEQRLDLLLDCPEDHDAG